MITDIHCHHVPADFLAYVRRHAAYRVEATPNGADEHDLTIRGRRFRLNTSFFDIGEETARMDRLGIDRTVLSLATPFIDYNATSELAVPAARLFNDALGETTAASGGRLLGWACLPMQDPEAAAAELRRCVRDLGFVGGHVASNVRGVFLGDDGFCPVHDEAERLGVPLFVHPADPAGTERMQDYELTVVAGYLFDNTINLLKLVCSGFLERRPNLKLVFAHAGAFGLLLRNRMQREVDTNPEIDLPRPVHDYLARLWVDSVCFEPAVLRHAIDVVGAGRVLMGSDAPFPLGEPSPVTFVRNSLDPDIAARVLSDNASALFGR